MDMAKPKIRFKGYTDEWEQRKLGELAEIVGGGTPSTSVESYWDGDIDWYAPAEIGEQIYLKSSQRKITEEGLNKSSAKVLPVGTVLFTSRAGIGKTAILLKEGCTNQGFQSIVPNKNKLDSYFIFTRSEELKRYGETVGAGSTFVEVSGKQMANMELMMPTTMDEQQKIGEYFSNLDNLITLHQRKAICTKNVRNNHILSIFLWERAVFMGKMILYHGSPNEMIHPIYGLGEDKHDYGRGFYLTANIELAKEWAVCRPDQSNGWVHKYELETDDLRILDFQQLNVLSWLAELMKHREASDSKRYRVLAVKFIDKYGIDTDGYDVIKGWRADASYFYIAKAFVRDEIDVDILEELLFLGDLGIQYCIKSEKGYANLHELESELLPVSFADFNDKYNERDIAARENMRKLIDSDANKVTKVFSTLI